MRDNDVSGMALIFIADLGVGVLAAFFLATKTREQLHGKIVDGLSDGIEQFRGTIRDLHRGGQKLVSMAMDQVGDAIDAASDAYVPSGHA